ncbi:MAG: sodium:solute symporter family protein [Clostridiales bacterium]|nr:sodium:solute symporter family protein [Clostridiales bacterium]
MDGIVLVIVLLYLILILGIGFYSARKIKDTSDYIVAGRSLTPIILMGTLAATALGGGSTLGVVGNTYTKWGLSAVWYVIAIGAAFLLLGILAPRMRKTKMRTVPEFFRKEYGKLSGLFSSILTLISVVGLTAAQMKASAAILEVMLGMDYNTSLLVVAFIVSLYSILGGFWSVALTDLIQLILIVAGMCIAIPFALHMAGGWSSVCAHVPAETFSLFSGIGGAYEITAYFVLFFTSFAVGQEVVSGIYAASGAKSAKRGSRLAGILIIVFSFVPVILGITMIALYNMGGLNAGVMDALDQNARYALPALAVSSMPSVVVGILFAGVLSATMSSADSSLLGAGAVFSSDIYRIHIRPEASGKKLIAVTRLSMVFVMFCSFLTAIYSGNILTLIAFSMAIRAAGSFVPFLMGHLWKKSSQAGCLASLVLGTAVFLILQTSSNYISSANAMIPSLAASAAGFFLFSILFPSKEKEEEDSEEQVDTNGN